MINVYDIILNWTDQNKAYDFFEWDQNDDLEHIKKIPLYKVDYRLMHDLWYHTVKIDALFLESILRKTEVFFNKKIEKIEYGCLFSDGYKVIAVEFASDGTSIYKSSLLLDEEEEIQEIENSKSIEDLNGKIKFDHVKFGYDKDNIIINDFSAEVKDGQKIAIVGPTGAGKTTMVKLVN